MNTTDIIFAYCEDCEKPNCSRSQEEQRKCKAEYEQRFTTAK
jgi:hypothetical protein